MKNFENKMVQKSYFSIFSYKIRNIENSANFEKKRYYSPIFEEKIFLDLVRGPLGHLGPPAHRPILKGPLWT